MKYVLDSSVAFKWFVREHDTDTALPLRENYRDGRLDLVAPEVFSVEVVHAITKAERQKRIGRDEGRSAVADLFAILPRLAKDLPILPRAYDIASTMRIGIYDCLYVALAERERCESITADEKLVRNLSQAFPFIVPLSSLR